MDKLNVALKAAQKHYFWVGIAVIVILGIAGWTWAKADLAKRFGGRKTEVQKRLNRMTEIAGKSGHPNAAVAGAIAGKTDKLKENVGNAWEILYQQQKAKNRLPDGLSKDFKDLFVSLQERGWKEQMPERYREQYMYFIRDHFPKLFSTIGLRRPAEETVPGAEAKPGAIRPPGERDEFAPGPRPAHPGPLAKPGSAAREMVGIVDWDDADRKHLYDRFTWQSCPSTLRVRLAQEDLWVYEALLRIIKNINEGATTHEQASIKRIEAFEIGTDAIGAWAKSRDTVVKMPTLTGGAPSGGPAHSGMEYDGFSSHGGALTGPSGGTPATGGAPGEASAAAQQEAYLLAGRYVDNDAKPLAANATPPYAEFNMMPIRMRITIDQRKIPMLLVECANSNMPIEVRMVRIRPGTARQMDLAALATVQEKPSGGPAGPFGMPTAVPRAMPKDIGSSEDAESGPLDLAIEIQGIIYIFNPVDRSKLGTGSASQEKPATVPGEGTPTPKPPPGPVPGPPPGPVPGPPPGNQTPPVAPGNLDKP